MPNLAECANQWDRKQFQCKIIIDTPKGSRNKFAFNPKYRTFELRGLLPEGLAFPFDFGFIPGTMAEDGDPLDIMVLMDEPAHSGCLMDVRVIGVIEAEQSQDGERFENDRLIGVAVHSYSHEHIKSLSEVQPSLLDQVEEFFVSYNKSRGKKFKVKGRHGPKRAAELLESAIKKYQGERKKSK